MHFAHATLSIKTLDEAQRVIEGIASTPTPDRSGDIMEPEGARFTLPLPLLWQHDLKQPIGEVFEAAVTSTEIRIKARVSQIDDPGPLKTRLDDAWQSIQARLVRGLSVGYLPTKVAPRSGVRGKHIQEWQWAELSPVTIPDNVEATILRIKALDEHPPEPAEALPVVRAEKGARAMTIAEQITQFENTRAAKSARMNALMQTAADNNVTLDAPQTEEYDGLALEVKSIDAHLVRMRDLEKSNAKTATPITATTTEEASRQRGGDVPVIQVKSLLPKGTVVTRWCQALAFGGGDSFRALEFAKQWRDSTPEVELLLKAAVAPGTTTDATWAGPLVQLKPAIDEFLELLRAATIVNKLPLRPAPFNVSIPSQTGGSTVGWVGQNAPKPVGKLTFGTVTLTFTKVAGIVAITKELARFSSPSAEQVIRTDMINAIAAFIDTEFIDPAKAAVANVSPGSVTNGVTPITTAGTTPANARTDMQALLNAIVTAGLPASKAWFIMSESNAMALSASLNALSQPLFPNLAVGGGTYNGAPVVTSQAAGNNVIALVPDCIFLADDGGVTIDASEEASLQMDSAPDNPATATTVMTSLWQNNLIGLRAERFINWKKARTGCVQYTVATYAA